MGMATRSGGRGQDSRIRDDVTCTSDSAIALGATSFGDTMTPTT